MKKKEHFITHADILRLLDYDPETGVFRWRVREQTLPGWAPGWNGKNAGKVAGTRHNGGYLFMRIFDIPVLAHRVAWMHVHGHWPPHQIDHINMMRDDNRIANLRLATNSQNTMNRKVQSNSASGFRGVRLHKASGLWHARITANGRAHSLGYWKTPEEASKAYQDAARVHHKEFTRSD